MPETTGKPVAVGDIVHYRRMDNDQCIAAIVTFIANPESLTLTGFPPEGGTRIIGNVWSGVDKRQWHWINVCPNAVTEKEKQ